MPNDAKLGLVVGVAVVTLIAVIFFRRDPAQATTPALPGPKASAPELPAAPRLPTTIPTAPARALSPADDIPMLPPPPMLPEPGDGQHP